MADTIETPSFDDFPSAYAFRAGRAYELFVVMVDPKTRAEMAEICRSEILRHHKSVAEGGRSVSVMEVDNG